MAELAGKAVVVKISGDATSFTAEATTTADNTSYQLSNAAKRVFDKTATITVKDGGSATAEDYTLNRLSGTVTFESADAGRVITMDGDYLPMSTAAYAHEFTFGKGVDILPAPKFGDTHKAKLAGQKFAYGTISQWDMNSTYFSDALTAGDPVVIEFRADGTNVTNRVWALLESQEMQAAIEGVQDEIVSFISTDSLMN